MKSNMKKYSIEGLSCANCAAQIEEELRALPQVKALTVDFATQTMHIELHDVQDTDATMVEVGRIASRIEPGMVFVPYRSINQQEMSREKSGFRNLPIDKSDIARLSLGVLVFLAATIIPLPAL